MYKINTHNISGVRNKVNNPDWRIVMTNYVCMQLLNLLPIYNSFCSLSNELIGH